MLTNHDYIMIHNEGFKLHSGEIDSTEEEIHLYRVFDDKLILAAQGYTTDNIDDYVEGYIAAVEDFSNEMVYINHLYLEEEYCGQISHIEEDLHMSKDNAIYKINLQELTITYLFQQGES